PAAWPSAVSPDLKTFALGRRNGSVTLYDLAAGKGRALTGRHSSEVTNVRFSDDSRLVISTGRDRAAIVWDRATGAVRDRLIGHNGEVLDAAFGGVGDGTVAYTVGTDGTLIT